MSDLDNALRDLRHLYEQMLVPGRVFDTAQAARGLLGPAIERIELCQFEPEDVQVAKAALEQAVGIIRGLLAERKGNEFTWPPEQAKARGAKAFVEEHGQPVPRQRLA